MSGCTHDCSSCGKSCSERKIEKLKLNDAALEYEPETSAALGFGFRCGFLGLLHLEIIEERLDREFDLGLITTAPSVIYKVHKTTGEVLDIYNPADLPPKMVSNHNFSIEVLSDKGEIVRYNFHYCEWFYWRSGEPIAWCELPVPPEEIEK